MTPNTDSTEEVLKAEPARLSKMFALASGEKESWQPEELHDILASQLVAELEFELDYADRRLATQFRSLSRAEQPMPRTLGELFRDPRPPTALLTLAKNHAKAAQQQPSSGVPRDVALVLYYLSIAAGLVRRDKRITELNDAELRRGFDWALKRSWLVEEARELLAQGRQKVGG
jgi:hypothetical protein